MHRVKTDRDLSRVRRRIAEVRRERYEQLERETFEKAFSRLEVELNSRRLCGPVPSVIATIATVGLPIAAALGTAALLPTPTWYPIALVAIAASTLAALIGSRIWSRSPRSRGLPFGELMLWSWIRHRRAEKELVSNAQRLGLSRAGDLVAASPLSDAETLGVLYRLNAALEHKDPYTLGHSRRVEKHCYRIAIQLGLPAEEIEALRLAAALHDIGKLIVPDSVLAKTGKLDDRERELMNQHAAAGAKILGVLDRTEIVEAVRHHHERFDGAGYPDGIAGRAIPRAARAIAVADTYDAITSSRPYRGRSSRHRAVMVLREERGRQFDPEIVDAMLRALESSAIAVLLMTLMYAPRKAFERVGEWFRRLGAEVAAPAAAVAGAALLVAGVAPSFVIPPKTGTPTTPVPTMAAPDASRAGEVTPADEVLGARLQRKSSDGRKTDNEARATRKSKRSGAGKGEGAAGTGGRTATPVRESVSPTATEGDESSGPTAAMPDVKTDPHTDRGNDCSKSADVSRGALLHCGP